MASSPGWPGSSRIPFAFTSGAVFSRSRRAAPNGYRVYAQASVDQLRFIKKAQSLGFALDEIKRILNLRGRGRRTCRCVVSMAEATLEETERKLEETRRFADSLRSHLQYWRKQAGRANGWPPTSAS